MARAAADSDRARHTYLACRRKEALGVSIEMKPIGFVRTGAEKVPRSWRVSDVEGALVVDEAYKEGLRDIESGQRIVVIFNFHESPAFSPDLLRQTPPHRRQGPSGVDRSMGIFSICSPVRPNPIGMSVLEVLGVEGNVMHVRGLDMIEGSPILDIKPYLLEDNRDRQV
jgi:tRNA (adenine37-N6)-methyltransferase